jgi:hypothetical protein
MPPRTKAKPLPPTVTAKRGDFVLVPRVLSVTAMHGPTTRTPYFVAAMVSRVNLQGDVIEATAHDGRKLTDIQGARILSADKVPGKNVAALLAKLPSHDFATLAEAQTEIRQALTEI